MTAAPPDITVDYSALWAHSTSADDLTVWAPQAARQLWTASGQPHSRLDVDRLAAKLEVLATAAFRTECFGAFFLCPEPARGPRSVVRLDGLRYPAGTPVDAVVDEVLLPVELQLLEPHVEHLAGPGAHRIRVRQRAFREDTRTVSDHVTYVFPFTEAAWLLSVAFPDPRDTEQWLPELDALASGVQVDEGGVA
ncbi:hypothetical protein ACI79C_05155 [Geodermatophilus sp. SYSU D00697]